MSSVFDQRNKVDAQGNCTISGDLTVNGTTTTINSTTLTVDDKVVVIASGAADSSAADGAGISVDGADATLLYDHTGTQWEMNKPLEITNTGTQLKAAYDADSSFTVTVTDASHTTLATAESGNLILDAAGDIELNADGADIVFKDGTHELGKFVAGSATLTIGSGVAEDTMVTFDGNAQDFRIGLDDGNDQLEIGQGTSHGTNTAISINSSGQVTTFKLPAAAVAQASDHIMFFDGGATGAPKVESIADLMTAVAGAQATTGLTASSGTLVVTDLHPVGVSGSANQVITDDGDGTVTSEAKLLCDGATTTIGDGTAEDAMLAFDGNAQDFRVGIDDGTDTLEIGQGTTMGTNTAISVNSSGQVTAFNIPAAAVAQASDHIIFLDGGATGAPKAESIDDFLTAIAGSGISVSSSQLTASGGASANDSNTILHMQMFA